MKHFTVLCVILALHGSKLQVIANTNSSKVDILTEKMADLVDIYNEELDKKVQWKVLDEAVRSIRVLFNSYHGQAKDNMKSLLEENKRAHDEYLFAVGPLFQWCRSVKNDLPHTVSEIQKANLSEETATYIIDRTKGLLLRGVNKSKDSIDHVQRAIDHMSELHVLLTVTEMQINEDFSSNGYYGIERSRIASNIAELNNSSKMIAGVLTAFGLLCTVILGFVFGPVGVGIGLAGTLAVAGIPLGVIHGHLEPTFEQQIIIIDVFYKKLEEALIQAKQECKKIDQAVKSELTVINELATDIQTPQPEDLKYREFSTMYVDALNRLSGSCRIYVESHGSTKSRRRRAAVAKRAPMTPASYTFDAAMLLNENYGVIHETVLNNVKQFFSDPLYSHIL